MFIDHEEVERILLYFNDIDRLSSRYDVEAQYIYPITGMVEHWDNLPKLDNIEKMLHKCAEMIQIFREYFGKMIQWI